VGSFTLTQLTQSREWAPSSVIPTPSSTPHRATTEPGKPEEAQPPPDIEALCQAAREHGRQEAAAALQAQMASVEQLATELQSAVEQVRGLRKEVLGQSAQDIASLVTMLTKKIAGDTLVLDPEALPNVIQLAISELPSTEELKIHVSPGLLESTSQRIPEELRGMLVPDPEIDRGCIVRTRFSCLDATLETAARSVQDAIDAWMAEWATE